MELLSHQHFLEPITFAILTHGAKGKMESSLLRLSGNIQLSRESSVSSDNEGSAEPATLISILPVVHTLSMALLPVDCWRSKTQTVESNDRRGTIPARLPRR